MSSALEGEYDDLSVVSTDSEKETRQALENASIFAASSDSWRESYLEVLSPGDWIQITGAGYEQYPIDKLDKLGVKFSNGSGLHDPVVSEHVFALAFAFSRLLPMFEPEFDSWSQRPEVSLELSDWVDHTLSVYGLGNIGESIAERGEAFGMEVYGIKQDVDGYEGCLSTDHVFSSDRFHDVLPETDLLVASVPLTEATRESIDAKVFELLPNSAIFINVARGSVADETALLEALRSNEIAGAGLDVFEQEPLPDDSPFWSRDDVIVTPHVAGRSDSYPGRFASLFLENYERWCANDRLVNQIL
jgi:D-2-hydroxyacid dehydrogenase (NADP+)